MMAPIPTVLFLKAAPEEEAGAVEAREAEADMEEADDCDEL